MTATDTGRLLLLECVGILAFVVVLATVAFGLVWVARMLEAIL
jgi:hypothetical protein